MPWGIIIDCICLALGGLSGGIFGTYFPKSICEYLSKLFGITSMAVGISLIGKTSSLTPVMLSLILGAIVGETAKLEDFLDRLPKRIQGQHGGAFVERYTAVLILLCFGSIGLIGAMTEGMTGDPSLVLTKAVLDFFGAGVFASTLGVGVALIALPQLALYLLLFLGSSFIMPYASSLMTADFMACGGVIALATGLRVADIKWMRVSSLLPSLILIMPISALWHQVVG